MLAGGAPRLSGWWRLVVLAFVLTPLLTARVFSTPALAADVAVESAADPFGKIAPAPVMRLTSATQRVDGLLVLTAAMAVLWITLAEPVRRISQQAALAPIPNPGRRRRALLHAYLH